jgi:hypothetical protein
LRGSSFGLSVRIVRCEKDRELLSRLHASSDAGAGRRTGWDAGQERREQSDDQALPEPMVPQNRTPRSQNRPRRAKPRGK